MHSCFPIVAFPRQAHQRAFSSPLKRICVRRFLGGQPAQSTTGIQRKERCPGCPKLPMRAQKHRFTTPHASPQVSHLPQNKEETSGNKKERHLPGRFVLRHGGLSSNSLPARAVKTCPPSKRMCCNAIVSRWMTRTTPVKDTEESPESVTGTSNQSCINSRKDMTEHCKSVSGHHNYLRRCSLNRFFERNFVSPMRRGAKLDCILNCKNR